MTSKGFAKADRTRNQVPDKREKLSATQRVKGIPALDHTERDRIIERLRNRRAD